LKSIKARNLKIVSTLSGTHIFAADGIFVTHRRNMGKSLKFYKLHSIRKKKYSANISVTCRCGLFGDMTGNRIIGPK